MPHELPPAQRISLSRRSKLVIGVALVPAFFVGTLIVLRLLGLLRSFSVPTGAMTPAVSAGDHVIMEGMTFLARKPHRGDIVVFRTDGIDSLPSATLYIKRVAGEPGDHLQISEGKLFVNDKRVAVSNAMGEIIYDMPPHNEMFSATTNVIVPDRCYFVLGDNSTNSLDSRFWGSVPQKNIIGRILFCYWPPERVGGVK